MVISERVPEALPPGVKVVSLISNTPSTSGGGKGWRKVKASGDGPIASSRGGALEGRVDGWSVAGGDPPQRHVGRAIALEPFPSPAEKGRVVGAECRRLGDKTPTTRCEGKGLPEPSYVSHGLERTGRVIDEETEGRKHLT
jgi:hypothetical protein